MQILSQPKPPKRGLHCHERGPCSNELCLVPRSRYFASVNRFRFRLSEAKSVSFVSDTSPKLIDLEGLGSQEASNQSVKRLVSQSTVEALVRGHLQGAKKVSVI